MGRGSSTIRRALAVVATLSILGFTASPAQSVVSPNDLEELPTIEVSFSRANALNNSGQIAGSAENPAGADRAVLWQPDGTMIDLGSLGGDSVGSTAINNAGTVVGFGLTGDDKMRAFIWNEVEGLVDLGTLGGDNSAAFGIADSGLVVGFADTTAGAGRAATWSPGGAVTALDNHGDAGSVAWDINGAAQIVGAAVDPSGITHAVLWDGQGLNDLGTLGGTWAMAWGINDSGAIVGERGTTGGGSQVVVRYPDQTVVDVGNLGGDTTFTRGGINNAGQIVGISETAAGDEHGFFWDPVAGMADLGTLGGDATWAWDINDAGVIVGSSELPDRMLRGFVTTAPEAAFSDVPFVHPFYAEIEWLASTGITTGYPDGTYRPTNATTRQADAAYLYRLAGSPAFTPPTTPTFSDVPFVHPFYAEIEWLASTGITTGYPDGTYRPASSTTRQADAAYLYRLAGSPAFTPPTTPTFADVPAGHPFYTEIEWLASTGITTGYPDGTYRPTNPTTRQADAAYLYRWDRAGFTPQV